MFEFQKYRVNVFLPATVEEFIFSAETELGDYRSHKKSREVERDGFLDWLYVVWVAAHFRTIPK